MGMIAYINSIKRAFRDQHNLVPTGGNENEPLFAYIQPGIYPMMIDGRPDYVEITQEQKINCCNFNRPPTCSRCGEYISVIQRDGLGLCSGCQDAFDEDLAE